MQKNVVVPPQSCRSQCHNCSNQCNQKASKSLPAEKALELWILRNASSSIGCETVSLIEALDRVAGESVSAKFNIPIETCAMHDGIAVNWDICQKKWAAGDSVLQSAEFCHCPMGTAIPPQFDTLTHAEQCCINPDGTARLFNLPVRFQSVQRKGSSIAAGETVLSAGEKLTPSHLAMLQYTGHTDVRVKRRPKISILPVGGDLKAPGETPGAGENIECNSIFIRALAQKCGAEAEIWPIVPDEESTITEALRSLLPACDAVVTIGGVGRGEKNYGDRTVGALRELGTILCYGVNLSPGGKNVILGYLEDKPVLGIPGPPHAALIMSEYFLPPVIESFLGCPCGTTWEQEVTLGMDFPVRSGTWIPRVYAEKSALGYQVRLVDHLGDTIDNFIHGIAEISICGDASDYRKGSRVNARFLYDERTAALKMRRLSPDVPPSDRLEPDHAK